MGCVCVVCVYLLVFGVYWCVFAVSCLYEFYLCVLVPSGCIVGVVCLVVFIGCVWVVGVGLCVTLCVFVLVCIRVIGLMCVSCGYWFRIVVLLVCRFLCVLGLLWVDMGCCWFSCCYVVCIGV